MSTVHDFLEALRAAAHAAALPLVGSAALATYDDAVPPRGRLGSRYPSARGVVVLAQGGGGFWERFRAACPDAPSRAAPGDPLDAWTRVVVADVVAAAQAVAPLPCRIVFPSDAVVDFRRLGAIAGIGVPSQLGILIHPEFGPWLALRAAVLVPRVLAVSRGLDGYAPCDACPDRPCESACPAAAISARGWDVRACSAHRLQADETCGGGCHARLACPVGAAHRYPDDALRFHQTAAQRLVRAPFR